MSAVVILIGDCAGDGESAPLWWCWNSGVGSFPRFGETDDMEREGCLITDRGK